MDRKKFLVGDDSQIEKYISYRLELCTVDCREILNRIMDSVISDGFIERMSPVLRKEASKEELREKIYRLLEDNCNLLHTATFRGHQGRVLRPDRAILSGQS